MKAKRKPAAKTKRTKPAAKADAKFYRKLGEEFRELESPICDLSTMANIADDMMMNGTEGQQRFAVTHLREMIQDFKEDYLDSYTKAQSKGA
jgi:hypothetical protein